MTVMLSPLQHTPTSPHFSLPCRLASAPLLSLSAQPCGVCSSAPAHSPALSCPVLPLSGPVAVSISPRIQEAFRDRATYRSFLYPLLPAGLAGHRVDGDKEKLYKTSPRASAWICRDCFPEKTFLFCFI